VRAFVTGASGFLGHAVCAELLARGGSVVALVRRPGSEPAGTDAVAGDLSNGDVLLRALSGAAPDCVIHLAAEIATQRDVSKIDEVNVNGTRRLLEACRSVAGSGGVRFIFVSTVVTGDAGGSMLDEDSVLPVESAYGRSKQEGERLVRESGVPNVIIRPSHVYGPGGWYAEEIVKRLRAPGRFVVIGSGANWWDVVRVEDVAATAAALGIGPPRRIPAWLARRVAGDDLVSAVVRSARSSNARIKRELGWQPRYPSAAVGVPDAVAKL
jgi:nucleoside-diphosphate-sugar epimerase